ncbi:hypothetical protein [Nonomuraea jabiensis]|uniref:hypothetical protein n=1 Tax=Nonomuraea jabiensis TaxID=882448 RepID=UPI003D707E90
MPSLPAPSRFSALRYLARNGVDHRGRDEQDEATGIDIRCRDQHAEPKREFVVGSDVRLPDHRPYVAW